MFVEWEMRIIHCGYKIIRNKFLLKGLRWMFLLCMPIMMIMMLKIVSQIMRAVFQHRAVGDYDGNE